MESNVNHDNRYQAPSVLFSYFETRDNFNHKLNTCT